jgi:hypothetical protein
MRGGLGTRVVCPRREVLRLDFSRTPPHKPPAPYCRPPMVWVAQQNEAVSKAKGCRHQSNQLLTTPADGQGRILGILEAI